MAICFCRWLICLSGGNVSSDDTCVFQSSFVLGAGSVIHALSDEQDLRKMGGIWRKVPVTYAMMWIGSLALAGFPFFAGYYSKDMILEAAHAAQTRVGDFAFVMGCLALS